MKSIFVLYVYLDNDLIRSESYNSLYEAIDSIDQWADLDMDSILSYDIEEVYDEKRI